MRRKGFTLGAFGAVLTLYAQSAGACDDLERQRIAEKCQGITLSVEQCLLLFDPVEAGVCMFGPLPARITPEEYACLSGAPILDSSPSVEASEDTAPTTYFPEPPLESSYLCLCDSALAPEEGCLFEIVESDDSLPTEEEIVENIVEWREYFDDHRNQILLFEEIAEQNDEEVESELPVFVDDVVHPDQYPELFPEEEITPMPPVPTKSLP